MPLILLALLVARAVLTTAGIGVFNTGVQRDWWAAPASCSSPGGLGANHLPSFAEINIVLYDEVSWAWLGLSLTKWNAMASLALAILWFAALMRSQTP